MSHLTFKEFEHRAWQGAVDQYDFSFSKLTRQMIPALLEVLEIKEGINFLDIACGPGYLAKEACSRGALACGVDFSSSMISRAQKLHPEIKFFEGDAEDLKDFSSASFESVAMNFGIIHLPHPEKALKETFRVLKPRGKMAFTAWCKPQEALGFLIVHEAVKAFGNPDAKLPAVPPLFFYSDQENCKQALIEAGFKNPRVLAVHQRWELNSEDELFEAFYRGTPRTGGLLKAQSPEQLTLIKKAIRERVKEHLHEGKIILPMPAMVVWGTKEC